jgi:hypothetical protein
MLGEMRGEDVEVAAVARQPMHAGDDMVLARVAPFIKGDAMSRKLFCAVPAAS